MEMCNWDRDKSRLRCATEIEMELCNWDWDASRWGCTSEIEIHWDGDAQQRSRWKYTTEIEVHHDRESQLIWRSIKMDTQKYDADALRWRCATEIKTRNWDQDAQLRCTTEMHQDGDVQLRLSIHWDEDAQLRSRWRCTTEMQMEMCNWDRDASRWSYANEMEMHQDGDAQTEIEMHQDKDAQLRSRWKCATERFRCSTNGGSGHQLQLLSHEKSDCIS